MKSVCGIAFSAFIILSKVLTIVNGELFTALVELEPLLQTKQQIIETLDRYLKEEEVRLKYIKRLQKEYDKLHKAASSDMEGFLSNPVNAFLLVKSLTKDWATIGYLADAPNSKAVLANSTDWKFPDDDDLNGAATAIMNLQDAYLLKTDKLSRGEIENAPKSLQLSANDCFEIGQQAYREKNFYHATLWFQEAADKLKEEEVETIEKSKVLDHLAYCAYHVQAYHYATKLMQELVDHDPNYANAQESLNFYRMHLVGNMVSDELAAEDEDFIRNDMVEERPEIYLNQRMYEKLCRGERVKSHLEESKLYCRYTHSNSSYLLLQPVKEEVLNLDPWIAIYHGVISDNDIEIIKNLSIPKLERATVQNTQVAGALKHVNYRVSKSAWLKDTEHPRVAQASMFIEEVTKLATGTAEELQIVNYGIGGHYAPHVDFSKKTEAFAFVRHGTGNRLATWIYYFSDVEAGGGTAFPEIGVHVKPRKGSAGFWHNLYRNGEGDMRTRHGGCPVLAGTKWVANKWIHEKDQEFRRRCSLNPFE